MRLPFRGRAQRDAELDEEIRSHLAMAARERVASGESPEAAAYAVRREFGNVGQVKELTRQMWAGASLDHFLSDMRYALRSLRKRPGFTAVAVVTLALGIGAATAVFSVVEGVLLRPLPFPHADRLVDIRSNPPKSERWWTPLGQSSLFSLFDLWRQDHADFEDMAAASVGVQPTLTGLGPAQRVFAPAVTANWFSLYGATPEVGRLLLSEDDRPGAQPVVVLSHRFWRAHLGSDPHVIGRTVALDTTLYTVVGVAGAALQSSGPLVRVDMWRSIGARLAAPGAANDIEVSVLGRLRPGVAPQAASARLDTLVAREWVASPETRGQGLLSVVTPLQAAYVGHFRTPLLAMLAAVTLVLLIACANVGGLLTARTIERGPEIAVRQALGAGRRRLLVNALTESLTVALAGGALGILLAFWLVPALLAQAGSAYFQVLPPGASASIDVTVLLAAVGMAVGAGVLAGLAPALLARGERAAQFLKSAGPGSLRRIPGTGANRVTLAFQVALTLVLLTGAGLLGRSFLNMVTLDLGFDPSHVVTAGVQLPNPPYAFTAPERRVALIRGVLDQLHSLPGVSAAAIGTGSPMRATMGGMVRILEHPSSPISSGVFGVTHEYFRALGIPIIRGAAFDRDSAAVVVINETAARQFFAGENPLGKQIALPYPQSVDWTVTVTGLVADTRISYDALPQPIIYYPLLSMPARTLQLVIRATRPGEVAAQLQGAVQRVDPSLPVDNMTTYDAWLSQLQTRQRFYGLVLAVFALSALGLSAAGVFGSVSFAVAQRTRELGLRIALGAERRRIIRLIVGQAVRVAVVGAILGIILALMATRLLKVLLYHTQPVDPLVFALVSGVLVVVCLMAGYIPARRAATVDPMVALRAE